MSRPTYYELQQRVRELEQIVNLKVYPEAIPRDLFYFRINKDWHFDFFDRNLLELTGYDKEEFLNRNISWLDVVHQDDREIVQDAVRRGTQEDSYFTAEFRIVKKEGEVRWIKMRGPIFCDKKGDLLFIQGLMNDITSQRYMEMALDSKHEIFVWVANCLEDGIYMISEDYQIRFMNKALINLVGDHMGETCYKALFQRETVCPWSVRDVIQQEKCGFQEYHLPHLGKTFQVRSFPIRTRDGTIGKLGQLKDITQTKKLKSEVERFEARHRAIVDAAGLADVGIFFVQDHGGIEARFRYVNEALCRMTGYSEEEFLNRGVGDLVHPDDFHETMERYRSRQRGANPNHSYELRLIRKDGTPITVSFSVALSSFDDRVATVAFVQDLTEKRRVQKSLWLSQRLASIGKLSAEIAHEINNPLTSVLTFTKLLRRVVHQEPFPENRLPDVRNFIDLLNAEAVRCADIARNLLDFSRQGDMELKENDIHDILEKTLDVLRHRAQLNGIRIETAYAAHIPHLFCDFKRLQQAFVNIFWNAMEAMPEGGTLSVSTAFNQEERLIRIEIRDTGMGISDDDLEQIFEPFFTTKAEGKGVGLGLSVAYGIIRQHQGQVHVNSVLGQGTKFSVQLRVDLSSLGPENSNSYG